MFDGDFSFNPARSPSLDSNNTVSTTRETSRSVSPCSTPGPYPPATFSLTDLASCFANSKFIRREAQICYDPCDSYASLDDDAGWEIPLEDVACTPPTRATTPQQKRHQSRSQRQVSARLLCSTAHHKDIASLVASMVESKEQCSVAMPAQIHGAECEEEACDEGYDSCDDAKSRRPSLAMVRSRLDYRGSSDLKSTGACVSKTVRLRKKTQQKRIRSSEHES